MKLVIRGNLVNVTYERKKQKEAANDLIYSEAPLVRTVITHSDNIR